MLSAVLEGTVSERRRQPCGAWDLKATIYDRGRPENQPRCRLGLLLPPMTPFIDNCSSLDPMHPLNLCYAATTLGFEHRFDLETT